MSERSYSSWLVGGWTTLSLANLIGLQNYWQLECSCYKGGTELLAADRGKWENVIYKTLPWRGRVTTALDESERRRADWIGMRSVRRFMFLTPKAVTFPNTHLQW